MSSSRFHPIEEGVWDDPKLDGLSFEAHAFFVYLFSNYRQRPSGIYRASDEQLSADTGIKIKTIREYLILLHDRQAIVRDGHWIFLPGYLKRQSKNERLLIGVESDVMRCDSTAILTSFSERYPLYSSWSTDRLQTLRNFAPSDHITSHHITSPQTTTPQRPRALPEVAPWPSPEALFLKYNREATDNCPAITTVSRSRIEKAKRYLLMFPDEQWWTATFAQYHRSKFLNGTAERNNGHKGFTPDLDWLLSVGKDQVENAVKVHDGRYRDAS